VCLGIPGKIIEITDLPHNLAAVGNDVGYQHIFTRQIIALII
jgi:hydrogenase maturation factor